jgi:hypothetical protein
MAANTANNREAGGHFLQITKTPRAEPQLRGVVFVANVIAALKSCL